MRRRARPVAAVLLILLVCSASVAHASTMSYNYSFDWSVSPWNVPQQNLKNAASNAKYEQDLAGYTGMAYYGAEPVAITNNLGSSALRHLFLVGHAEPGCVLVSRSSPYPNTSDYAGFVTSNINKTGWVYKLRESSDSQVVRQTSYVSNVRSSAKIAMFLGCRTAADPSSGYNLLWSAHGHAGVQFAGGFQNDVIFSTSNWNRPPLAFGYRYWWSLRNGYNAWYSMEVARAFIYSTYGTNYGYDSGTYRGDGNVRI